MYTLILFLLCSVSLNVVAADKGGTHFIQSPFDKSDAHCSPWKRKKDAGAKRRAAKGNKTRTSRLERMKESAQLPPSALSQHNK